MLKFLSREERVKSDDSDEPESGSQAGGGSGDSKLRSKADTLCEPQIPREGGFMFNLVKDIFGEFFGGLLWINLAFCAFIGFVRMYSEDYSFGMGVIGLILGVIVGMLLNIIFGGFVATIISIERNTAKIRERGE